MERDRYQTQEARMINSWHDRYADPLAVAQPAQQETSEQPTRRLHADHQPHVDFNYMIDMAHASGDPMALLEAQLRMMGMESLPPAVPTQIVFDAKTHQA